MKLSISELNYSNYDNNNSMIVKSSENLTKRFLMMSEKGNHTNRNKNHFFKRISTEGSGGLGKSFNMSQIDSPTFKKSISTYRMDKRNSSTNPFEQVRDDEKEFKKNFKGKIPLSIIKNIEADTEFNKLKDIYKGMQDSYDENYKAKIICGELNNKMKKLMTDLDRAKAEKEKINDLLYETRKNYDINKERLVTESMCDVDFRETLEYVETAGNSGNSVEDQIESLENEISKLKVENKVFYEDYDTLCEIYKNNRIQNQKLENEIKSLDGKITKALTEKNNLEQKLKQIKKK
ncbi:MAG: hypothetical protein MJ252_25880 [archaeon]|nr:hypothetical protein [archaeon]